MRVSDLLQNLFVFFRAGPELLKGAIFGGWLKKGLAEPSGNIPIPKDFFGIGVAGSDDPACNDYIVARLKELGLSRVRLDWTYDSRKSFQEGLLRRLISEKFQVCLHLVKPFAEARKMLREEGARRTWR